MRTSGHPQDDDDDDYDDDHDGDDGDDDVGIYAYIPTPDSHHRYLPVLAANNQAHQ